MSVIHIPRKPELDLRILIFPTGMGLLLSLIFFRLWYFQVVKAPELTERADATRQDRVQRPAPRGLIFDRHGELLAGLRPEIVITAVYDLVKKDWSVVDRLAAALNVDPKKLRAKIDLAQRSPGLAVPIYLGASPEVGTQIAEAGSDYPGIGVELTPMRYYPDGTSFTHVLGYVRLPNQKDIKRIKDLGRDPAPFVGKGGLEQFYETDLMGQAGDEVVEIDAKRRPVRVLERDNPMPGKQFVLTLDAGLQRSTMQLMKDHGYIGSAVALDPNNGEVLCMVSSPTFDEKLFERGISKDGWDKLDKDPDHPMVKRAIRSSFSPGSTFKIVTSLAAYETGKFDPNRSVYCAGGFRLGTKVFKCLGHHGPITYRNALEKSCNTYFADLGYRVGEKALRKACEDAGLGQPTEVDLGGESIGVVPTDQWMAKHFKDPHWYGGDTINFSIGQGYVRATPIQMADLAEMVANSGVIYRPHLVKEINNPSASHPPVKTEPEELHHVNAAPEFWSAIQEAMVGVIDHGTAGRAQIPGVVWAGKTGSAEHGKGLKTHSWFVGYAPADHPRIAVCVLIEDAGHGGDVAAPIAREIVKRYLTAPAPRGTAASNSGPAASISAAAAGSPSPR